MLPELPPPVVECVAPIDVASCLAVARRARMAGDFPAARHALEAVLQADPRNADAWVQLGFVLSATGETAAARTAFLTTLEIASGYDDAKLGLARLAHRAGDGDGARAWLDRVGPTRANDPEVRALRATLDAPADRAGEWRMDLSAAHSSLTHDLPAWREATISVSRRAGARTLGAGLGWARRFDRSDLYGEARLVQGGGGLIWGVAVGAATRHIFKPQASLRFEAATPEERDWTLDAAATFARYDAGPVNKFNLRAGRRLGPALRVSAQGVVVRDETGGVRTGYGLGATLRAGGRSTLSLGWADAPESSEGVTVDVRAVSFGVSTAVSPDLRLRADVVHETRRAFDRTEVSLGLSRSF